MTKAKDKTDTTIFVLKFFMGFMYFYPSFHKFCNIQKSVDSREARDNTAFLWNIMLQIF